MSFWDRVRRAIDREGAKRQAEQVRRAAAPVVRMYRSADEYQRDAVKMTEAGYVPRGQSQELGKINVGRTVGKAVVFLPWALLRPSRAGGPIIVTWVRSGSG